MLEGLLVGLLNLVVGAIGGVGALAIAMLTKFGDRFINYKFDERIERYKSTLEGEIEQLKSKLAHFTDRAVRSNELEYEAITAAWQKYIAAHRATSRCIIRFMEHPDFNNFTAEQVEDYLKTTEFSEQQKKQMRDAPNRNEMFGKIERLRSIAQAGGAIYEAHEVLGTKGIFIPKELETEFKSALEFCSKAWAVEKTNFSHGHSQGSEKVLAEFFRNESSVAEGLKEKVRDRILAAYSDRPTTP